MFHKIARLAVYFDLENEIPGDATVLGAKFQIYRYDTWEKSHRIDGWYAAYKITNPSWVSQVTSTTYLKPWQNKGGDYTGEGADTIYYTDTLGWFDFEITSHVQDFVKDPSKNYGIMLSAAMDNPNHIFNNSSPKVDTVAQVGKFHSMKASDVELRPKLVVTYTTDSTGIITKGTNQTNRIICRAHGKGVIKLYSPYIGLCTITDIRGRKLAAFSVTQRNQWITRNINTAAGIILVTIRTENNLCVQKSLHIR